MILFGANDACLPGSNSGQHVPLARYKENLRSILQNKTILAHAPRLIVVVPPPVDEYSLEISDATKGIIGTRRTAEHTKLYADACREVANDLGAVVLDLWAIFMQAAGYEAGQILPGSKKADKNAVLGQLLSDGRSSRLARYEPSSHIGSRPPFYARSLQALVRKYNGCDKT
ncbi:MAG: hypothetical protein Q9174_001488 [Haloplaca sp. 1 TL-2023]